MSTRRTRAAGFSPGGPHALDINAPTKKRTGGRKATTSAEESTALTSFQEPTQSLDTVSPKKGRGRPAKRPVTKKNTKKRKVLESTEDPEEAGEEPTAKRSRKTAGYSVREDNPIMDYVAQRSPEVESEHEDGPSYEENIQNVLIIASEHNVVDPDSDTSSVIDPMHTEEIPDDSDPERSLDDSEQQNSSPRNSNNEDIHVRNSDLGNSVAGNSEREYTPDVSLDPDYSVFRSLVAIAKPKHVRKAPSEMDDSEWAEHVHEFGSLQQLVKGARKTVPFNVNKTPQKSHKNPITPSSRRTQDGRSMFRANSARSERKNTGDRDGPSMTTNSQFSATSPSIYSIDRTLTFKIRKLTDIRIIDTVSASLDWFENNPKHFVPNRSETVSLLEDFHRSKQTEHFEQVDTSERTMTPKTSFGFQNLSPHQQQQDSLALTRTPATIDQKDFADPPKTPSPKQEPHSSWASALSATAASIISTPFNFFTRRSRAAQNVPATDGPTRQSRTIRTENPPMTPTISSRVQNIQSRAQSSRSQSEQRPAKAITSFRPETKSRATPTSSQPLRRGRLDGHLPVHLRGCLFEDLPLEWQAHPESQRLRKRHTPKPDTPQTGAKRRKVQQDEPDTNHSMVEDAQDDQNTAYAEAETGSKRKRTEVATSKSVGQSTYGLFYESSSDEEAEDRAEPRTESQPAVDDDEPLSAEEWQAVLRVAEETRAKRQQAEAAARKIEVARQRATPHKPKVSSRLQEFEKMSPLAMSPLAPSPKVTQAVVPRIQESEEKARLPSPTKFVQVADKENVPPTFIKPTNTSILRPVISSFDHPSDLDRERAEVAKYVDTIPYEVFVEASKRIAWPELTMDKETEEVAAAGEHFR